MSRIYGTKRLRKKRDSYLRIKNFHARLGKMLNDFYGEAIKQHLQKPSVFHQALKELDR